MEYKRNRTWSALGDEVTPEPIFRDRRRIIAAAGAAGVGLIAGAGAAHAAPTARPVPGAALKATASKYKVADPVASEEAATSYNNFYEFGTNKSDPVRYAGLMKVDPWTVTVEGECEKPGAYAVTDLVDYGKLEERIYRLRCVEAWSMVIPWVGVPMASVIDKLKPTSKAKYVAFETHLDRTSMPGVRFPVLDWPYVEGLRLDEAMNELTLMTVGLYGKALPQQNGAPLRLIVPWKYGFKSIKSVVKIRFTDTQPPTSWNLSNAREYGFYSNVNPEVDHPRWSQASERVLGGGGLSGLISRRKTDMFNGYTKQVEKLYAGMDLAKDY
ncbi:protein-methionine-sulfoxide reductase catalytic subunit MsrP [bacterium]|nr:protein-methionine-sulfoxide reductase catalytic subunit MsrP [bacterium]